MPAVPGTRRPDVRCRTGYVRRDRTVQRREVDDDSSFGPARAAGRRAGLELRLAEDRPGDAAPSPEGAVLASEPRAALVRGLNQLKEEDRVVIAYRYFLDLSEAEMAAALGVARGTVKSRLSRSLKRLRAVLGDIDG